MIGSPPSAPSLQNPRRTVVRVLEERDLHPSFPAFFFVQTLSSLFNPVALAATRVASTFLSCFFTPFRLSRARLLRFRVPKPRARLAPPPAEGTAQQPS
ncbi:hypothetical protein CVT25_000866 [Psilocybe cyanescens]|uniref:Uncharacterized protein n=1 Tax=Psilocybe cyanescens TaxID=93625 RepID=A0A409VTQ3_PSICY|nr:hypothetical protein CVT25_000866 [Psilocybe cyanescens]